MKFNSMKILIVGFGDVGSALHKIIKNSGICGKSGLQIFDPHLEYRTNIYDYDVIHICIPYNDKFKRNFLTIVEQFNSKVVIIESTVSIDCFENIDLYKDRLWIYSPVRGTHPDMVYGLRHFVKFGAPIISKQLNDINTFTIMYYDELGINFDIKTDYKALILGKLLSTSWYGMLIAFCNNIKQICEKNDISFEESYYNWMLTDEIGQNYTKCGDGRAKSSKIINRPVMTPGKIGGHCVIPNIELLSHYAPLLFRYIDEFKKEKAYELPTEYEHEFIHSKGLQSDGLSNSKKI